MDMDVRNLKWGLVGLHGRLYVENAEFHASIDTLVYLLPVWVDGLARRAEERGERLSDMIDAMRLTDKLLPGRLFSTGETNPTTTEEN